MSHKKDDMMQIVLKTGLQNSKTKLKSRLGKKIDGWVKRAAHKAFIFLVPREYTLWTSRRKFSGIDVKASQPFLPRLRPLVIKTSY